MNIFTKQGTVFLVQVDHLSGESLGRTIDYLYAAGAANVQIIPTITKKNRPAHLIFVDGKSQVADAIEQVIAMELTTGGWHRLETQHRHLATEMVRRTVHVESEAGCFEFVVEGKRIGTDRPTIRPEHEISQLLKEGIQKKFGIEVPLTEIYHKVYEVLNQENVHVIRI